MSHDREVEMELILSGGGKLHDVVGRELIFFSALLGSYSSMDSCAVPAALKTQKTNKQKTVEVYGLREVVGAGLSKFQRCSVPGWYWIWALYHSQKFCQLTVRPIHAVYSSGHTQ